MDVRRGGKVWLSAAVGLFALTATLLLWHGLMRRDQAEVERVIADKTENLQTRLSGGIQARVDAMTRLARRWELRRGMPQDAWAGEAEISMHSSLPGDRVLQARDGTEALALAAQHDGHIDF